MKNKRFKDEQIAFALRHADWIQPPAESLVVRLQFQEIERLVTAGTWKSTALQLLSRMRPQPEALSSHRPVCAAGDSAEEGQGPAWAFNSSALIQAPITHRRNKPILAILDERTITCVSVLVHWTEKDVTSLRVTFQWT